MKTNTRVALVVDDEAFARLLALQILLDEGFAVLEAGDAAEGLEMLDRNDDVALLFTDISMPGEMDGIGLAERVAKERPEIGLLLTSGHATPADAIPAEAVFLPKPYSAHGLVEAIRSALDLKEQ